MKFKNYKEEKTFQKKKRKKGKKREKLSQNKCSMT